MCNLESKGHFVALAAQGLQQVEQAAWQGNCTPQFTGNLACSYNLAQDGQLGDWPALPMFPCLHRDLTLDA
jgi:hypothetical protein